MMNAEMDSHLGYEKSQRYDSDDYRKSTFEPQIVKNVKKIYLK